MNTSQATQDYTKWNLPEGAKARLIPGVINDIQFSPDGTQLAVASSIGIWIYDAHTGEELNLLLGHKGSVSSITYFPNEPILASGGRDDTVRLWDMERGVNCKTLQVKEFDLDGVYSIVCQDDGILLASGRSWGWFLDYDYDARLWVKRFDEDDVSTIISEKHPDRVVSVVFNGDGTYLALGSEDGTMHLWDTERGVLSKTLKMPEPSSSMAPATPTVKSIVFSSDGQLLASGGTRCMCLWDVAQGKLVYQTSFLAVSDGPYSMCFSADRRLFAIEGGFNNIFLYNVTMDECLATLTHTERDINNVNVTNLAFSPDSRTLASGNQDGTVLLWDVDSVSPPNIVDNREKVILGEEKPEFQDRESQIRQICKERGITTLVHFTRIENLRSILQEGLIGRSFLEVRRQRFLFNDDSRADGHKEAVCLSISFPNYQMFYGTRKRKEKTEGVDNSQWVIFLITAEVLWELDCAFCQDNAARKVVSGTSLEDRKRPDALETMFGDFYDIRHQDLLIPENYPTHPQAEVLVSDPIPVRYIKAIHFWNEDAQNQWLPGSTGTDYETACTDRTYFKYRSDYEVWKPENFKDGIPLSYIAKNNAGPPLSGSADDDDDIPF